MSLPMETPLEAEQELVDLLFHLQGKHRPIYANAVCDIARLATCDGLNGARYQNYPSGRMRRADITIAISILS